MSSTAKKELTIFIILFLLALTIRLVYLSQLRSDPSFDAPIVDAEYHDKWAMAIRDGETFHEGPYFRAPLYVYFLALIYTFFGHNFLAVRIVQLFIGSLSVLLIYHLGKRIFDRSVGLIAGLLAAFNGVFIYFEGELLIPVLILFLDLVMILTALWSARGREWWRWLICGAILGLSAIARPNVLIFLGALIPWLLVSMRRKTLGRKKMMAGVAGLLLGVVLVIMPVTVRNAIVGKDFVPIASQGGVNFYIGNNPQADGVTAIVPGTREDFWGGYQDAIKIAVRAEKRYLKASEVSNYWFRRGFQFWREQPMTALRMTFKKFGLFWGGAEIGNNKDVYFISSRIPPLGMLIWPGSIYCPFGIVAPLALAGMVLVWRRREGRGAGLTALFIFSYMASVIPFFVTARFRLPVIPFLLPFAAYTIISLVRARVWTRFFLVLILILIFGLLVNLNLAGYPQPPAADSHTSMGHLYLQRRLYSEAEKEFRKALSLETEYEQMTSPKLHAITGLARVYAETGKQGLSFKLLKEGISRWPNAAGLHFQQGHTYYADGRLEEAIASWRETVRLDPEFHQAYLELGNAYEDQKQYGLAIAAFQNAVEANPRYVIAFFNMGLLYSKMEQIPEAMEAYRKAVETDPAFADAHANLAWLHAKEDVDLQEGFRLIRRALELDEENPVYWDVLAELYISEGKLEEARKIFGTMIEREPGQAYWKRRLKEIEN
ncbi:tetratricopeptide repeat protein [Candidatus Zixiibacteriota bacterium]